MAKGSNAAFQGLSNGAQQHVVSEWLCEEFHRPCLHGLHRGRHIAVAGDEDDRHVGTFDSDALLKLKTSGAGKRNVQHQAAWDPGLRLLKEFLCGSERFRLPALTPNQQIQRLAHCNVVVNNEYYWHHERLRCRFQIMTKYAGCTH